AAGAPLPQPRPGGETEEERREADVARLGDAREVAQDEERVAAASRRRVALADEEREGPGLTHPDARRVVERVKGAVEGDVAGVADPQARVDAMEGFRGSRR